MPTKLNSGQKHLLSLVEKGADRDGWAPVSSAVFPVISKTMPRELVELEASGLDGEGRARLTPTGICVCRAMAWL